VKITRLFQKKLGGWFRRRLRC